MTEPIQFELTVSCSAVAAFYTRTSRTSVSWPTQHTRGREPGTTVVIEPRAGGRIYERTPTGEEFDWGSVTVWQRPVRFSYRWHITSSPSESTDVEVRFADNGDGTTRVTIVHSGFDRLGPKGPPRREANLRYWNSLIPAFAEACNGAGSR